MTKGQLKNRLSTPGLFESITNIINDQTLGNSRKDQLEGLLFQVICGDYWDECNNNEEI